MRLGLGLGVSAVAVANSTPLATVSYVAEAVPNRIYQRTSLTGGAYGKGQGSVAITASVSATTPLWVRTRSAGDGTTIVQAPFQASAAFAGGQITVSGLDVPDVITNSAHGRIYLDIGPSASGPWTSGTQAFMIGRLLGFGGQSLAVRMISHQEDTTNTIASLGVSIGAYNYILATYNDSRAYMPTVSTLTWQKPASGGTYDGVMFTELLRRQSSMFGVACGLIGHAQGGVSISTYLTGQANATQIAAVIAQAGGAFESFLWYQGHGDSVYGIPSNIYVNTLGLLFTQLAGYNSLGSNFTRYIGSIPLYHAATWGDPYQANNVRLAMETYAQANSSTTTHVHINDNQSTDGIHELQTGGLVMAQHFARAMRPEAGLTGGDRGPALLSATRSGTTITATFSDVGQSTLVLTGTPQDRIFIFSQGYRDKYNTTNNRFAASSVSVTNKTTLSITLANDPGDGHVLDMFVYWPNDNTNDGSVSNIRDDRTDGDGITVGRQVLPNQAPITIAAPVPASTVNAPPSGFIVSSPFSMTATSPTYGSQEETGFGQTLSGGTATAATNSCPVFGPFTLECEFTFLANPAATQVLVGNFGSEFIGISSSGKITTGAGSGSVTLTANKRYHVAYQRGANGSQIYLTNKTDAGAGTQILYSATAYSVNPGSTRYQLRQHAGSSILLAATATLDEAAIFSANKYPTTSGANYTAPTAPYTNAAANIVALYHCDGDVTDAVAA